MGVSLRKAINEKCKQCTYDPLSGLGNWRQQIMACTVSSCALHPIRPVSKPRNEHSEATLTKEQ